LGLQNNSTGNRRERRESLKVPRFRTRVSKNVGIDQRDGNCLATPGLRPNQPKQFAMRPDARGMNHVGTKSTTKNISGITSVVPLR
jgi:hypothetical protein